jgi:hypothetical protein
MVAQGCTSIPPCVNIACGQPCGKVQLKKSLVLTLRSDFLTGAACKVVEHIGYYSLGVGERGARECASEVPCVLW